ncbi:Hsp70 family protein [Niveibacterium umoris]|uniref:Putative chaperone protein n=1 Tax=Niveibacterium umoris TaxID=1193620 RepID=A0A840BIK8_9RHOO|nr:Hsp70 family protein [Niveibacterium umoris]MBB4011429.1 putative chaperone protein [Niveibacterium umoris]
MFQQPARACGIDFGTSNSTLGWLNPGAPTLIALEDDKPTLPSAVFFNADEDSICFGREALGEYLDGYEGRLMRALKTLLGSSLMDGHTEVLGRRLPFRDLLRHFIAELKRRGEAGAGRVFDHAVFGRPVQFVDDDPVADRLAEDTLAQIAHAIGFREVSFQFEPIAAAFHYEQSLSTEELVLIADIGGGTSDFSLVRLSPVRAKQAERRDDLLANAGVHIGGTDLDRAFNLAQIMPLLGFRSKKKNGNELPATPFFNLATWHTINFCYTRAAWTEFQDMYRDAAERDKLELLLNLVSERAGHWLSLQVEEAKIALSEQAEVMLDLGRLHRKAGVVAPPRIARADFDLAIAALVNRVGETVETMLASAGVDKARIDTVFFTGGSSGVPALRQRIAAAVPNARAVEGDLFGSIGAGLAVEAARRYGCA